MPTLSELLVANARLNTELQRARAELAAAVAEPATAEAEIYTLKEQLRQAGEVRAAALRDMDTAKQEARTAILVAKAESDAAHAKLSEMNEWSQRLQATHTTPKLRRDELAVTVAGTAIGTTALYTLITVMITLLSP